MIIWSDDDEARLRIRLLKPTTHKRALKHSTEKGNTSVFGALRSDVLNNCLQLEWLKTMKLLAGQRCACMCVSVSVLAYLSVHLALCTDCPPPAFSFPDLLISRENREKSRGSCNLCAYWRNKVKNKTQIFSSGLYKPFQKPDLCKSIRIIKRIKRQLCCYGAAWH